MLTKADDIVTRLEMLKYDGVFRARMHGKAMLEHIPRIGVNTKYSKNQNKLPMEAKKNTFSYQSVSY